MEQVIKLSDWFCVAQEGKTIDGREIKRDWLETAAKSYNPNFYTAMIWCEHEDPMWRQFSSNFGTVEEVKLEEENGKLRLMARLRANQFLQYLNEQDQKIFTSIELIPDFPEEGQHYLCGLALTDQPASTGLSRLSFSKAEQGNSIFTAPIEFSRKQKSGFFDRFFKSKQFSQNDDNKQESNTMTEEEIEALKQQLSDAQSKITELEETIAQLSTKAEEGDTSAVKDLADTATTQVQEAGSAVDDAATKTEEVQLSVLKKQLSENKTRLDELEKKFSAARETATTKKPTISASHNEHNFH